jgi:glycine/D-amino acid oxidase-like deaminating enzyme
MPEDGMPVVGFAPDVPGLYLAAMHSGITLAPAVGRFAAMEILNDARVALLEPYRPARFASP